MSQLKMILGCFSLFLPNINSARILGVYPNPAISHQVVFRALSLELIKRGHEVVVITPNPAFCDEKTPTNLTEIDTGNTYESKRKILSTSEIRATIKRGVISDSRALSKLKSMPPLKILIDFFSYPKVKDFIADKSQKFDLVIVENHSYSSLIFSKMFDAPAILFSSYYGTPDNLFTVGAVSRHPLFYSHVRRNKFRDLGIIEKIQECISEWDFYKYELSAEKYENNFLKSVFGVEAPTVRELKEDYVELLFVNSHPIFDGNRPVPPGVVYLGGLHLQSTKPLPEDLRSYLDNSTRGVIYVSLGTSVRPSSMDPEMLNAFLDAFEALPYDIMWKFDGDNLTWTPKNVRIQKWFPQRDLLGHPNVKLFITQGGLQSTDEAIDAELPMVGIPCRADQWYNVNKYVELGIGVEVDSWTLTADKLVQAAHKVISDESFKKNIARLRTFMRDQPMKPIERAVWWTEYVLRHGRTKQLLSPTALMSWSEYLMIDVILVLAIGAVIVAVVITVVLYNIATIVLTLKKKSKLS